MRFIVFSSSVRPRIAIHAAGCRAAVGKLRQCVRWELTAPTAADALAAVITDEDADTRGLEVSVCLCCAT